MTIDPDHQVWMHKEDDSTEAVKSSILRRLRNTGEDLHLIAKHGIVKFMDAVHDAASWHGAGGLEEIGSSDVTAFVNTAKDNLGELKETNLYGMSASSYIRRHKTEDLEGKAREYHEKMKHPKITPANLTYGGRTRSDAGVNRTMRDEFHKEYTKRTGKTLQFDESVKIPKVNNLYEAYAKIYAQDKLGIDLEEGKTPKEIQDRYDDNMEASDRRRAEGKKNGNPTRQDLVDRAHASGYLMNISDRPSWLGGNGPRNLPPVSPFKNRGFKIGLEEDNLDEVAGVGVVGAMGALGLMAAGSIINKKLKQRADDKRRERDANDPVKKAQREAKIKAGQEAKAREFRIRRPSSHPDVPAANVNKLEEMFGTPVDMTPRSAEEHAKLANQAYKAIINNVRMYNNIHDELVKKSRAGGSPSDIDDYHENNDHLQKIEARVKRLIDTVDHHYAEHLKVSGKWPRLYGRVETSPMSDMIRLNGWARFTPRVRK